MRTQKLVLTKDCLEAPNQNQAVGLRQKWLDPKPHGYTVLMGCGNDLCYEPEHILLRKWLMFGGGWGEVAKEIAALKVGEVLHVPDYQQTTEEKSRMRNGIRNTVAGRLLRFEVSNRVGGGVCIRRKEDWHA